MCPEKTDSFGSVKAFRSYYLIKWHMSFKKWGSVFEAKTGSVIKGLIHHILLLFILFHFNLFPENVTFLLFPLVYTNTVVPHIPPLWSKLFWTCMLHHINHTTNPVIVRSIHCFLFVARLSTWSCALTILAQD